MQIIKNEEGSQVTSWMRHQDPFVRWKCPQLPNEKMGRMVSGEGLQGDQRKVAPGPTHLVYENRVKVETNEPVPPEETSSMEIETATEPLR